MKTLVLLFAGCVLLLSSAFAQTDMGKGQGTPDYGNVSGVIECEDQTLPFGYIAFFVAPEKMPNPSRYWMSADYVFPLQKNGAFNAAVPEGKYYALAVRRAQNDYGPIEAGDYFYYFMDGKGPVVVNVAKGEKTDLGIKKAVAMPSNPFTEVIDKKTGGVTTIEGFLRDANGNPVSGVFVVAHISPARRPDFISGRSASDGSYELRLPGSGRYYLVARSRLGRPPVNGDYEGRTADNMPVTVKTGESVRVDIKVNQVKR